MREIRRILCPMDFSDDSRHAFDHAVAMARYYGASVTALHVCEPANFPVPGLTLDAYQHEPDIEAVRGQLDGCLVSARTAGVVATARVERGLAARAILACAQSMPADLLVIGTHGATGFQHLALGSVTEKVLRQAVCPVLSVPPRARATSVLPFRRILCPVDFSPPALAALDVALSLAQEGDAEVTLLHVVEWPAGEVPDSENEMPASLRQALRQREQNGTAALQTLVPASVRPWCRPSIRLGHGKAYREILGVATEDRMDVIVMGVHGRHALDLMLFGSTTNQVVRLATCPVLSLRA